MIEAICEVSDAELRALDDRMSRIAAEIQTMNRAQRIESEKRHAHTYWIGRLMLLMIECGELLGQLQNQAQQNQQPGTSSTHESQGTSSSGDSL
jgi:molecular chaperone GrpE (heat shock protein)